jgi:hypothetical protein
MRVKVAANDHLGRLGEARAELSRVLAIDPKLTTQAFASIVSLWHRNFWTITSPACASPAYRRSEPPR